MPADPLASTAGPGAAARSNDPGPEARITLVVPASPPKQLATKIPSVLQPRGTSDPPPSPSCWLTFEQAREYLGFSRDALYKLTAARAIPFRKKSGGQPRRFQRDELHTWMEHPYPRMDRLG